MKRVLSWIVAFLCCYVFRIAAYLVFSLAFLIAEKIYYFSEVLFWVIVAGKAAVAEDGAPPTKPEILDRFFCGRRLLAVMRSRLPLLRLKLNGLRAFNAGMGRDTPGG